MQGGGHVDEGVGARERQVRGRGVCGGGIEDPPTKTTARTVVRAREV